MAEKVSKQLTVGPVRFSFLTVWEPRAVKEGQKEKYSTSILVPKKDTKLVEEIKAAAKAVKDDFIQRNGKVPPGFRNLLKDGDAKNEEGEYIYDENHRGHIFFSASANKDNQPSVIGKDRKPITDKQQAYSGMWGYAAINIFWYNNEGQGISAGLNHVMKTKDDAPFSSRIAADEAFKNVEFDDDDLIG